MGRKKRIIATVTNDLTTDQRMIRICTELSRLGFDVTLVGRLLDESKLLDELSFKRIRLRCWFVKGPLFYLEYNMRLFHFLRQQKPDAINTVDTDTAIAGWFMHVLYKTKIVFDAHEYFSEVPEVQGRKWVQRFWRFWDKKIIQASHARYTVCDSIALEYRELFKKNFLAIRNVPFARSEDVVKPQKSNSTKKILLYQGALNEGRCVDLFIQSMARLDAELWIAGEGDLSADLRLLAKKINVVEKVKFLGRLAPDELRQVTIQADIGLNVLEHLGKSYYYSLSNKFFDYVQAEIPTISSPFPEYKKLNEAYEVQVFSSAKADEFHEKVNLLLNNQELYNRLQENCVIAKKEWIWEKEREKIAEAYERI